MKMENECWGGLHSNIRIIEGTVPVPNEKWYRAEISVSLVSQLIIQTPCNARRFMKTSERRSRIEL